ncbi:hypothetical protein HJG60_012230 [Phyllostomus discolor]|uniref:LINE-1 type transposase domain-containing protein 1 n=1 Tax=Phyllostomus discolor TaxID=89673 RepID=A0A833ZDW7_9CHIR|nr:hypothetical protein HJG60_012230 [Phyllostomus discolor]
MQDNMKQNNIQLVGKGRRRRRGGGGGGEEEEEEERQQGIENLFEKVMTTDFRNLMRQKATEIQEAERVPIKRNLKRPTARHIIIKMTKFKDKERNLKLAGEKQEVTYKGAPIRLAANFSMETLQARRGWQEIFQIMKIKGLQTRLLYPARISIKMEVEIRSFLDK